MAFSTRLSRLLRNLTQRRKIESDLAEEVSSYVALSADRKMKEGLQVRVRMSRRMFVRAEGH